MATGDRAGAWDTLNRGLSHNDRLGQRALEAELKRRRALFLLDESPHDTAAAEAVLADALTIARGQKARMFELRQNEICASQVGLLEVSTPQLRALEARAP